MAEPASSLDKAPKSKPNSTAIPGGSRRKIKVLLIDDDDSVLKLLRRELKRKGIVASIAESAEEGLELLNRESFPVVVCDQSLPGMNGLDFLKKVKSNEGGLSEVILLTGHGAIDSAIEAIKSGAYHYLTKPVRIAELATLVRNAADKADLLRENLLLRREVEGRVKGIGFSPMVGQSAPWKRVLHLIERSGASDSTVLVTGRSGTGKELVARSVHRVSARSNAPFVAVNCASVVATLLESELFGHEAGAFTGAQSMKRGLFELANEGTLFLDEIGETSLDFQSKLLRVLETGEFRRVGGSHLLHSDVRIIAATNCDLKAAMENSRFREDLYYRLNVLTLELPALKERTEDVALLAEHFLALAGQKAASLRFIPEALAVMAAYPWPGNVRELKNVIERISILCDGDTIEVSDLPVDILAGAEEAMRAPPEAEVTQEGGEGYPPALAEVEKHHIHRVLEFTRGNKSKAAKILGITPATLYNKLKLYRSREQAEGLREKKQE
jgi:two-component system, NtrC family, response regulator AtoC